ncbi:hypothetical protein HDU89_008152 [Geranomyces variabilis]|nr:hypothetical protein HDU89_008152 [Geranomyces variabilis]
MWFCQKGQTADAERKEESVSATPWFTNEATPEYSRSNPTRDLTSYLGISRHFYSESSRESASRLSRMTSLRASTPPVVNWSHHGEAAAAAATNALATSMISAFASSDRGRPSVDKVFLNVATGATVGFAASLAGEQIGNLSDHLLDDKVLGHTFGATLGSGGVRGLYALAMGDERAAAAAAIEALVSAALQAASGGLPLTYSTAHVSSNDGMSDDNSVVSQRGSEQGAIGSLFGVSASVGLGNNVETTTTPMICVKGNIRETETFTRHNVGQLAVTVNAGNRSARVPYSDLQYLTPDRLHSGDFLHHPEFGRWYAQHRALPVAEHTTSTAMLSEFADRFMDRNKLHREGQKQHIEREDYVTERKVGGFFGGNHEKKTFREETVTEQHVTDADVRENGHLIIDQRHVSNVKLKREIYLRRHKTNWGFAHIRHKSEHEEFNQLVSELVMSKDVLTLTFKRDKDGKPLDIFNLGQTDLDDGSVYTRTENTYTTVGKKHVRAHGHGEQ